MNVIIVFIIIGVVIGALAAYFASRKKLKKGTSNETAESPQINNNTYEKKNFITNAERHFLELLLDEYGEDYNIQPQVCLMSIVRKKSFGYANELYRTVDIGIFDEDYNVVLLIEINDKSHHRTERQQRDEKVNAICNDAGIPLLTFWQEDNVSDKEFLSDCKKFLG